MAARKPSQSTALSSASSRWASALSESEAWRSGGGKGRASGFTLDMGEASAHLDPLCPPHVGGKRLWPGLSRRQEAPGSPAAPFYHPLSMAAEVVFCEFSSVVLSEMLLLLLPFGAHVTKAGGGPEWDVDRGGEDPAHPSW